MATLPPRVYRAVCPNCGAPVELASAASVSAVCSFCRSTLLRDGEALRRIGVVAELFDDHSPLQLGVRGRYQGVGFTLVGRLQVGYAGGSWNEWHLLFDDAAGDGRRPVWLSEDNGAYVIAFEQPPTAAPALATLQPGRRVSLDGRAWDVASVVDARLLSAEGELPAPPPLERSFAIVDLRNVQGEVGTLDFSEPQAPAWSIGRAVALSELALTGLRESSEKTLGGRSVECPSCGSALAPQLASTQTLSCPQCQAVVDLSGGVGADLQHYRQHNAGDDGGRGPQIALGRSGTLRLDGAPTAWQVVGRLERCTVPADGEDEVYHWREYLLYHPGEPFVFLVDADEGWSWVRPITGVPQLQGRHAIWHGAGYDERERYEARVVWVQGEFYWRVQRDERAQVTDYAGTGLFGSRRLSREQTSDELTWSAGATLPASEVAAAFGLPAAAPRDVLPVAGRGATGKGLMIFFAVAMLMLLLSNCGGDDCDNVRDTFGSASNEYRRCLDDRRSGGGVVRGGSWGGYSSGGGHK